MTCEHCETIRAEQRAFLAEHGQTAIDWAWMTRHEVAEPVVGPDGQSGPDLEGPRRRIEVPEVRLPRWSTFSAGAEDVQLCRCDCHTVARIGGALPPLDVSR